MDDTFAAAARRELAGESDRPLYLRLAQGLERKIVADGPSGLPSARGLAADIGVNRATVNAAYRELSRRGLVTVRPGRRPRRTGGNREAAAPAAPRIIDLARYAPDRELLPHGEVFRWLSLGESEGEGVAQYGSPWGYEPLRRWLAERLRRFGIAVEPDRILLTSGVQHALDLVLRAVTRPGDAVVVEDPTYPGLPPLLATHDLRPTGVPAVDAAGADPGAVAAAARASGARLAIVTPTLHNPTGSIVAGEGRRQLVDAVRGADVLLVEEFFDPALVIDAPVPPPLRSLDPGVVMVGSFSKSLFPGLRVGWLVGPDPLLDAVAALKTATDLSGSPLLEAAAWNLCRRGVLDQQLARLRRAAGERRSTVLRALEGAPSGVRWTEPKGGFSLLLSLPPGWSASAAVGRAAQHGIWLLPGPAMSVSGRDDILRLAFAAAGGDRLQHGLEKVLGILAPDAAPVPLV